MLWTAVYCKWQPLHTQGILQTSPSGFRTHPIAPQQQQEEGSQHNQLNRPSACTASAASTGMSTSEMASCLMSLWMRAAVTGAKDVVAALRKLAQVLPCWRGLAPQDIIRLAADVCPSLIACSRQAGADPSWVFTKVVLPNSFSTARMM